MSAGTRAPCPVVVVGAGLTGLMLASYLQRRGHSVRVYEARPRHVVVGTPADKRRSMSMDLSTRGLRALEEVGLLKRLRADLRPMRGRCHHQPDGARLGYAYGAQAASIVSTIERSTLHQCLLEHVLRLPDVEIRWGYRCAGIDKGGAELHFEGPHGVAVVRTAEHLVVGCDGVHSRVRAAVEAITGSRFSVAEYSHRYKPLTLGANATAGLDPEAMHVWTHRRHMVVAQPRCDGSFSAALLTTPRTFARLNSPRAIGAFFDEHFSTLRPLVAQPEADLLTGRSGVLRTVMGSRWHAGNLLVVGDAAHGMVPFFGQGMNSSFEDCRLLCRSLDMYADDDWRRAVAAFAASRVDDGNAIARLSLHNYPELSAEPGQTQGLEVWRALEQHMMHEYPDTPVSFHNLVCFTHLPYGEALRCKRRQEQMFRRLCRGRRDASELRGRKVSAALSEHRSFVEGVHRGAA